MCENRIVSHVGQTRHHARCYLLSYDYQTSENSVFKRAEYKQVFPLFIQGCTVARTSRSVCVCVLYSEKQGLKTYEE